MGNCLKEFEALGSVACAPHSGRDEISAQQQASFVLGLPEEYSTHGVVTLHWSSCKAVAPFLEPSSSDTPDSLTEDSCVSDSSDNEDEFEGDEVAFEGGEMGTTKLNPSFPKQYCYRGKELRNMCLFEYAALVKSCSQDSEKGSGVGRKRLPRFDFDNDLAATFPSFEKKQQQLAAAPRVVKIAGAPPHEDEVSPSKKDAWLAYFLSVLFVPWPNRGKSVRPRTYEHFAQKAEIVAESFRQKVRGQCQNDRMCSVDAVETGRLLLMRNFVARLHPSPRQSAIVSLLRRTDEEAQPEDTAGFEFAGGEGLGVNVNLEDAVASMNRKEQNALAALIDATFLMGDTAAIAEAAIKPVPLVSSSSSFVDEKSLMPPELTTKTGTRTSPLISTKSAIDSSINTFAHFNVKK